MTSTHKEQVKKLKSADPIQVMLNNTLAWLLQNTRIVVIAFVPIIIGVAGFFAWKYVQNNRRNARVEELGRVEVVYEGEQRQANDEREALMKKVEALDKAPATAPIAPDPAIAAQKDALQKQAEAIMATHTESRAQYEAFAKKYETKPEGWHAAMSAAKIYIDEEKFAEARPLLESVLAQSKDVPFYQVQARLTLIGILEEGGDYDKALEETAALEKQVDKELLPKVLLTRGRLQMLKNAKDEAKATFALLIENHGATPEAQKARSLQGLLN